MATQAELAPTADETLDHLLNFERQRRRSTPLRRLFLQDTKGLGATAPLSWFVKYRRQLALDLLLLLHCVAGREPWDVGMPAMAWARALEMPETPGSEATISKNWTWLEEKGLVRTERYKRLRRIYLLQEDGSSSEYVRPDGRHRGYFHLPFEYFTERWHKKIKMPGKAVLLVSLSRDAEFILPAEHASDWYKLSPDTIQRGLDELRKKELLSVRTAVRKAPAARFGITQDYHYRLQGPFAR